nr:hypothetical protein [Tanacetum cinerariifolium]
MGVGALADAGVLAGAGGWGRDAVRWAAAGLASSRPAARSSPVEQKVGNEKEVVIKQKLRLVGPPYPAAVGRYFVSQHLVVATGLALFAGVVHHQPALRVEDKLRLPKPDEATHRRAEIRPSAPPIQAAVHPDAARPAPPLVGAHRRGPEQRARRRGT